jgi:biopolymer transport protein TolQ
MLLETTIPALTTAADNRLITIVGDADIVIKLTLFVLIFFSVVSWGIIFVKWVQLRSARGKTRRFLKHFWKAKTLDTLLDKGRLGRGPALNIFRHGMAPLKDGDQRTKQMRAEHEARRSTSKEVEQLELFVPFLATTASVSPFIGLFGTVWGILNAFFELSAAGSSSLQVVGPRIAEALFVTAVGLVVAIPALIFYNLFTNKIRVLARDMEQFSEDLTHRIEIEQLAA